MVVEGHNGEGEGSAGRSFKRLRLWLRRVMPKVALVAGALFVLRLFIRNTALYRETPLGLIGLLTFLAVCASVVYYVLKGFVRLKQKLLWRVRRRLIITYMFAGLTPIVLLLILGYLTAVGGSSQAMARVVTAQVNSTQRQALEGGRTLAGALLALPANTSERGLQIWLDERAAFMRATLPGARVSVWRGAGGVEAAHLGHGQEAQFTSAVVEESTRGVGFDAPGANSVLPSWLEGQAEWSGLTYLPPPEEERSLHGTPAVRALVRREANGRAAAVLVTVPVSRALVQHYRENTGINVRPFFLDASGAVETSDDLNIKISSDDDGPEGRARQGVSDAKGRQVDFSRDQFGEPMPSTPFVHFWFPVFLPATDWLDGEAEQTMAFTLDWSWAEGSKQLWSNARFGEFLRQALLAVAIVFLALEVLALLSAAWMTRAVTGTVHKLYQATQSVMRGDFSHRIRTRSRDQLGELAVAFNEMSSNIEALLAERVEHERLEREIEIAAEVQAQLFPRGVPALSTVEMTGECRAARGVAGDYYDYIEAAPGLVAFALGDVSGKGISASLVMSNLQATLRAQVAIIAERLKLDAPPQQQAVSTGGAASASATSGDGAAATKTAATPADAQAAEMPCGAAGLDRNCAVAHMTASINEQLCRSTESNRFATLFLALYDDRTRLLRYTNAGHNSPLLVRAGGTIERLTTGGTMVGAFDWVKFEEGQVTLEEGDLLVIFSDGLSEAQNLLGEEYGEERLTRFAVSRRRETVNNIRAELFDEIDKWTGAVERGDDQTLVILKAVNGDR
ncbi:MAG TPA: SpoIIE family protein phosphatase [Pyrinomonadaceae bacterium]|nr:SpoIIE family protein phosphatase [Pyrinomonadaceae bacterium]